MKDERSCQVCGTRYSYCPNCRRYSHLPRWMFNFHDENCMHIWEVSNDYRAGVIDEVAAKRRLEKLDLSQRENFMPVYQEFLDKVMPKMVEKSTRSVDKKTDEIKPYHKEKLNK